MLSKTPKNVMALIIFFTVTMFSYSSDYLIAEVNKMDDLFVDKMNVRITMDLQNTSLRDTLKMLSVQSGLNFVSSEAVADRRITLYLDNVLLKDALDKIFDVNNLSYTLDTETDIFTVTDWGKPSIKLDTKIYFLRYASATNSKSKSGIGGLKSALENVMSESGKIVEDPATNSMVITDMPSKFPLIEQVIAKLDVPIPQVMIEVEVLDVDKTDADKVGIKYFTNSSNANMLIYTGPSFGAINPFASDNFFKGLFGGKKSTTAATWNMQGLQFVLDFLATRSTTKFLARPKLFVLNNETAQIKLSSEEAVGAITTTQGQGTSSTSTTSAERAETGVTLEVTPQISMATGEITMALTPTVKEAVSGLTVGGQTTKDVEERSLKSTVRVRDGETIILGGLIRQRNPTTITKFAFLGDIPILGMLFRHKDTTRRDREILVFLTPRIIKSSADLAVNKQLSSPKLLSERQQESFIDPKKNEIVSRTLGLYDNK